MSDMIRYVRRHLTLRLGIFIILIVTGIFGLSLALLFHPTRQYVRQAAERRATKVLGETVKRISGIMDYAEHVTAQAELQAQQQLHPDSLLMLSRRVLEQHPDILGFTIAMQPNYFPDKGRYYSVYSLRTGDSITTVVEALDYFSQIWYKTPWDQKRALWLEPYIDDAPGFLTSSEYNFSFVKPFYTADGKPVGVICTDMLLKWLSQTASEVKPFPHSSAIMLGDDGRFIVHPDTTKLVTHTIFSDPETAQEKEIIPLGHAMISGQSGNWAMRIHGKPAHVFYCPLQRTDWSIAIVCPDSDVFSGYYHMLILVWVIIVLALTILLVVCYQIIRKTIIPVNQLAATTRRMADGEFDADLPVSQRKDTVGQLQNSFVQMQQSILTSISSLQTINAEMEQRNKELQQAYKLVREADANKTAFIQDMYHEIRTPLNIINGFTQVIAGTYGRLPASELDNIFSRMKQSAQSITLLTHKISETAKKVS